MKTEQKFQKITPFLWFDHQSEEAVHFYTSLFKNSRIGDVVRYGAAGPGPEGTVMTISFSLEGTDFVALNGGPQYQFTPATSFFVVCETHQEIDNLWNKLSDGGKVMMELNKYPFSEKYGWIADKYGISWQLMLGNQTSGISPSLLFVGNQNGNAEKAIHFYTSLFQDSGVIHMERYLPGEQGEAGTLKYASFTLCRLSFVAMDSNMDHKFNFSPAVSFVVYCESQEEVDRFWDKLSEGGEKNVCGWLTDRFGVTWQVVPTILPRLLVDEDTERSERVIKAMLKMDKLNIQVLKQAYDAQPV